MSNSVNLLYQKLSADSQITTEAIIKSLINFYMDSDERQRKVDGINYYDSENTAIKDRKEKDLIVNHRSASGFYKKLVDQKVNYCVGKDVVVNYGTGEDGKVKKFENIDIPDCNDFLIDICEGASQKGIEWLYLFINAGGMLDYKIIDSLECIPIWDTEFEDTLKTMIRFYQMEMVENDKTFYRNKVELYDDEKVTYYIEDNEHNYIFDVSIEANPIFYNSNKYVTMGNVTNIVNFGWGQVPFIPLFNTKKAVYDLQNVKADIDLYDVTKSDFANNFELNMEAIMVIVNRGAQNLEKFKEALEKYRIIEIDDVSDVGGVSYLTLEIPYEARKTFLDIIRKDIYSNGFGVDTKEVGDGNITNVVIKSRYADLDLKANKFIRQIKRFLKKYYEFANIYLSKTNKTQINIDALEYTFNKSLIFNESELIDGFVKQGGRISKRTLLSNHPNVDDVEKEMDEIEKDDAQYDERFGNNTDNNLNDGDEDGQ